MLLRRAIRNLLILVLVIAIFAAVGTYIAQGDRETRIQAMNGLITQAVSTAIQDALFNATRTAEADQPHYLVVNVPADVTLLSVAEQYDTTIDVLRMANNLLADVDFGNGTDIIVPRGIQELVPPRRFKKPYVAQYGDTLSSIATLNNISLEILMQDNPILAQRGINPNDIVFIPELL
ncbi:MAG: LysM peptidoglycan-binding domain-containing protein [Chloroflexi bacterium]|nr:LysM peptidoglycan-binding domain-containing protein [Chloroflexota bacterium]